MIDKILLLDDNKATNYIHTKFINNANCTKELITFEAGADALEHLANLDNPFPNLLFVDINMPTMDAWEFFERFKTLERPEKDKAIAVLLTTSLSPSDEEKIKAYPFLNHIMLKPLNPDSIAFVLNEFF